MAHVSILFTPKTDDELAFRLRLRAVSLLAVEGFSDIAFEHRYVSGGSHTPHAPDIAVFSFRDDAFSRPIRRSDLPSTTTRRAVTAI